MSLPLKLSSLTPQIHGQIGQQLVIKPKQKFHGRRNHWRRKEDESKNIVAYYSQRESDTIFLPYFYGTKLIGFNPHATKPYPQTNFQFTKQLYDYQQPIVNEAMAQLVQHGTSSLYIYASAGKTVTTTYLLCQMKLVSLIMISSVGLAEQWRTTFKDFSNIQSWVVGEEEMPSTLGVIICMDTRIDKIPPSVMSAVGFLAIDEADTFCTQLRFLTLLRSQPRYVLACSATLKRSDELHKCLYALCGTHHVYRQSTKPFNVYKYNTGLQVPIKTNKQGQTDWTKLLNDLCELPQRNALIMQLVQQNLGFKILILTRRVSHANILYQQLAACGLQVDYMYGTKKTYNDSHILIGTTDKIGRGFDEKAGCADFSGIRINLLILAASIASETPLEQVAGRVFRADFPNIIHMVDNMDIFKKKHWPMARRWYTSRNGTIHEVDSYYQQQLDQMGGQPQLDRAMALQAIKNLEGKLQQVNMVYPKT